MADSVAIMWSKALEQYAAGLEKQARERILSIPSLEALLSEIGVLRAQYAKKTWARIFDRLNPILQSLSGFNQCVQTFTQAAPKGFILLWGSLSLILEVIVKRKNPHSELAVYMRILTKLLRLQRVTPKASSS